MSGKTKIGFSSIGEKNRAIERILQAMAARSSFLLLGHHQPDDDCIASLVSVGLLLSKMSKEARICIESRVHEHFEYLLDICRYNSIGLSRAFDPAAEPVDTIVLCDTPKPAMIEAGPAIRALFDRPEVLKIEIDHHIGGDGEFFGDEGYRLVDEASSACELIGHLALKLAGREELLRRFQIGDPFSRNLVLSILTGMIGDTQMGRYLKSRRERKYYRIFSGMFDGMLARSTVRAENFANMQQVFGELQRLSAEEERCCRFLLARRRSSPSVGYVLLAEEESAALFRECGYDTLVSVARAAADLLAEESGRLSLVGFLDPPGRSNLAQFRIRRSHHYHQIDLRTLLARFSIRDGGGHEGAIGFRLPREEVGDLQEYGRRLIERIEEALPAGGEAGAAESGQGEAPRR